MPGYGFSLAVRVGGQIYFGGGLGFLLQFLYEIPLASYCYIFRLEILLYVYSQLALR